MIDGKTLSDGEVFDTDFCVIGSGAGGAVAAWELSRAGLDVIVIEDGDHYKCDDFTDSGMEMLGQLYRDAGLVATVTTPFVQIPHARCVGGTTVINCGTSFRLPQKYYGRYEAFPSEDDLNPHFDEVEERLGIAASDPSVSARQNLLLKAGAEKLGYRGGFIPRNAPDCQGSGNCNNGCRTGKKLSMENSFVPWAVDNGAKVIYNLRATRLKPESDRVVVSCSTSSGKGRKAEIRAKQVLVAAGALHTPRLLKHSGLDRLSRQVGRNLSIHPTSGLTGEFPEPVEMWKGIPQAYYVDEFAEEGIFFEGIGVTADLTALSLMTFSDAHAEYMANIKHMASIGLMVSDEPVGSVRTRLGLLWISYRLSDQVVSSMKKAYVEGARMMFAAGAKRVHFAIQNLAPVSSIDELDGLDLGPVKKSDIRWGAFHPLGTCRIGKEPSDSVVDHNGRVHGQERIFVCDGSVLPASTQVNPQLAIMAVARWVAGQFCK